MDTVKDAAHTAAQKLREGKDEVMHRNQMRKEMVGVHACTCVI